MPALTPLLYSTISILLYGFGMQKNGVSNKTRVVW